MGLVVKSDGFQLNSSSQRTRKGGGVQIRRERSNVEAPNTPRLFRRTIKCKLAESLERNVGKTTEQSYDKTCYMAL